MGIDTPKVNSDVPEAEAKAEGQRFEWLHDMCFFRGDGIINPPSKTLVEPISYEECLGSINDINKRDERKDRKPLRLPTKDELIAEFNKPTFEGHGIIDGFRKVVYLTGTLVEDNPEYVYTVDMGSGKVGKCAISDKQSGAFLVRDTA